MASTATRLLYPTEEAAEQLGVGLTTVRALIKSGELRSIKIGRARRVPVDALREYVQKLDEQQNGAGVAPAPSNETPSAIRT
jgi:excisionase family DNA binding protein